MSAEREDVFPPIEAMSDGAWDRVERAVFAELDAAPAGAGVGTGVAAASRRPGWRRVVWPALAALSAAAAIIVVSAWPAGPRRGSGSELSRIATGASATEISVGDAAIVVEPDSTVLVRGDADAGVTIILERGTIDCAVAPRLDRPPFVVLAGAVRVEVIGTRFAVSRDDERVGVVVREGVVAVISSGQRAEVRAGETWPATLASPPSLDAVEGAVAVAPVAPAGPERLAPTRVTGAHRDGSATGASGRVATGSDPRTRYEAAAALEASDPRAALAAYRALARGRGPWAANALFAAGRLAVERGMPDDARALLERYLRVHPHGPNAADAHALLAGLPPS